MKRTHLRSGFLGGIAATSLLFGAACVHLESSGAPYPSSMGRGRNAVMRAMGRFHGVGERDVIGSISFHERHDGTVEIRAKVRGLSAGMHGVHVHAGGTCSGAMAEGAMGHFDPLETGHHGGPKDPPDKHHAGDLGNMEVDASGTGTLEMTTDQLRVAPGPFSVVGHTVIIHAKQDNLTDNPPNGGSGDRMACAVIRSTR